MALPEDLFLYPPPFGFRGLQGKVEDLLKLVNATSCSVILFLLLDVVLVFDSRAQGRQIQFCHVIIIIKYSLKPGSHIKIFHL